MSGDGANYTLPNLTEYGGDTGNDVIYDFANATTLKFGGAWSGTILAPLANITAQGGVLDGSVVALSLIQSNELHQNNLFIGDLSGLSVVAYGTVPEPASIALLGIGAAAAALARRRRRDQAVCASRRRVHGAGEDIRAPGP